MATTTPTARRPSRQALVAHATRRRQGVRSTPGPPPRRAGRRSVVALALLVTATAAGAAAAGYGPDVSSMPAARAKAAVIPTHRPRFYVVRAGDTLGGIAGRVHLTLAQLQELNPRLDPQTLDVGQRIRLHGHLHRRPATTPPQTG